MRLFVKWQSWPDVAPDLTSLLPDGTLGRSRRRASLRALCPRWAWRGGLPPSPAHQLLRGQVLLRRFRTFDTGGVAAYELIVDTPAGGRDGAPCRIVAVLDALSQQPHGDAAVEAELPLGVDHDDDARWPVGRAYGRAGLVAMLTAGAAGAAGDDVDICFRERRARDVDLAWSGDDVPVLSAGVGPVWTGGLPAQSSGPRGGERLGVGTCDPDEDRSVGAGPVTGNSLGPMGFQILPGGVGFQAVQ